VEGGRRAGHDVGRDQVARLMRAEGIEGARRTKRVRTTRPDATAARHPDLVERNFTATGPNQLWVTDLTYVPTFAGIAYVCFIIDAFPRSIVGWRVASHRRTEMVLDALEMARWSRGTQLTALRCHSDAGSQFTSVRYGERLAEIGAVPSIGTVGDSFDNALAETVNGYYKAELIRGPARPGPWRTVDDVELATLDGCTGTTTSGCTAISATYRRPSSKGGSTLPSRARAPWLKSNHQSLHQTQGGSVHSLRRRRSLVRVGVALRRRGRRLSSVCGQPTCASCGRRRVTVQLGVGEWLAASSGTTLSEPA